MALNKIAAKLGEQGEDFVAKSLVSRGLRVLDRNWRIKEGEIDLVAQDCDGTIVEQPSWLRQLSEVAR
ncbi:MAG: YraN family protein [Candidatus Nanopelagicaceae bacterium]